jgi:hypothetical protein
MIFQPFDLSKDISEGLKSEQHNADKPSTGPGIVDASNVDATLVGVAAGAR